jgi:hypothetical protein
MHTFDHNIVFFLEKTPLFFAENCLKSLITLIITSAPVCEFQNKDSKLNNYLDRCLLFRGSFKILLWAQTLQTCIYINMAKELIIGQRLTSQGALKFSRNLHKSNKSRRLYAFRYFKSKICLCILTTW